MGGSIQRVAERTAKEGAEPDRQPREELRSAFYVFGQIMSESGGRLLKERFGALAAERTTHSGRA